MEKSMRKSISAAIVAAALLSNFAVAEALPAPRIISQDETSAVTPVRDGCGWNRHYSPRLRHCVWNWRRY